MRFGQLEVRAIATLILVALHALAARRLPPADPPDADDQPRERAARDRPPARVSAGCAPRSSAGTPRARAGSRTGARSRRSRRRLRRTRAGRRTASAAARQQQPARVHDELAFAGLGDRVDRRADAEQRAARRCTCTCPPSLPSSCTSNPRRQRRCTSAALDAAPALRARLPCLLQARVGQLQRARAARSRRVDVMRSASAALPRAASAACAGLMLRAPALTSTESALPHSSLTAGHALTLTLSHGPVAPDARGDPARGDPRQQQLGQHEHAAADAPAATRAAPIRRGRIRARTLQASHGLGERLRPASLRSPDRGRVAQLARAPRLHRGGRPFESGRAHHSPRIARTATTNARHDRRDPHPHRRDRLRPGRLLRRRAPAEGRRASGFEVDMIERLPTPWGLVRSGVAPDHPKIKSVTRVYEKTAAHPRFRYFGNVTFGEHVSREELLAHYHAIVYATGSPVDRPLGIPGEELPGSHAATEFVGWYNGHPDHTDLEVDLLRSRARRRDRQRQRRDRRRAHARARARASSRRTDTADHALEVLARQPRQGGRDRRPPRAGAGRVHQPRAARARRARRRRRDRRRRPSSSAALAVARRRRRGRHHRAAQRRDPARLRRARARRAAPSGSCCASCSRPSRCSPGEDGRLGAVELVRNELVAGDDGALRAQRHRRARERSRPASCSARSATAASPLPGVPFDERRGVIPNERRAASLRPRQPASRCRGEYVVGWIKRGPSGVIGTNKKDAQETVDAILADARARRTSGLTTCPADARPATRSSGCCASASPSSSPTTAGQSIDRHERALGETAGPPARQAHADRGDAPRGGGRPAANLQQPTRTCSLRRAPSARLSPAGPVSSSGRAPDF